VVAVAYVPERGDAVWIAFNPQAGHEQAGHRPALVLSPGAYNSLVGLALLCLLPAAGAAPTGPFASAPTPRPAAATARATDASDYRSAAARHVYAS